MVALAAQTAFATQSLLGKATLLYTNKLYDEAKRELVAIAVSDSPPEDRAQALNLLGDIAIDEGHYEAAVTNWTDLLSKYAGTEAALEAAAKLPLARKLAASPPAAAQAPIAVAVQTLPVPEQALAPRTVLVAGSAPEAPEFADQAVLEFMNLLTSRGVVAQDAFAGRVGVPGMSRMEAFSLPNLLTYANTSGAASVLYVFLHFQGMENMRVECYASDGKKLWSEKVSASMGLGPSGVTSGFIRRMGPKIVAHVGDNCLPVGSTR